jgi:hypothetical protein
MRRRLKILLAALLAAGMLAPAAVSAAPTHHGTWGTGHAATWGTGGWRNTWGTGKARHARHGRHARLLSTVTVTLPAGVAQTGPTSFAQTDHPCSCVVAIDGYLFAGMPYYDGSTSSAVGLWFELYAQPGYRPGAPIYSVSTTATVSGTVGDGDPGDPGGTG